MKIFNWVHRRFTHKDGIISQNVKKVDHIFTKDGDTQVLLDNVIQLADFLDGWQGGVLAIGTFGLNDHVFKEEIINDYCHYTLKNELEAFVEDEYSLEGDQCEDELGQLDEDDEDEKGELNPLVNGFEVSNCDPAASRIITIDGTPLSPGDDQDHSNKWDRHYLTKKERITLADLFSAESDGNITNSLKAKPQLMSNKPNTHHTAPQRGQLFPKKLIPGLKDDSRPLKKLHQLMKRMLKRKIHPDPEVKIHKDSHSKSSGATGIPSDDIWNNESVSLLQMQDMVCCKV